MIFSEIVIENMFCYRGKVTFADLTPTRDQNLIIIRGRNNFGKTSFLNCLKLLFGGVTDDLRSATPLDRKPGPIQYVRGDPPLWSGILNSGAVRGGAITFGISAKLVLDDGRPLEVSRRWDPVSGRDAVDVHLGGAQLDSDERAVFLQETFPSYVIHYLFFDGELIQILAADPGDRTREMIESLLRLRPISLVRDYVQLLANQWTISAADPASRAALASAQAQLKEASEQLERHRLELSRLRGDRESVTSGLRSVDTEVELIRRRAASEDRARYQALLSVAQRDLTGLIGDFVGKHLPLAPVWFNDALWEDLARAASPQPTVTSKRTALLLTRRLLTELFDEPLSAALLLTAEQRDVLRHRVSNIVAQFLHDTDGGAAEASETFPAIVRMLRQARSLDTSELVRRIRARQGEVAEHTRALEASEDLSDSDRARLQVLQAQGADLLERLGALGAETVQAEAQIRSSGARVADLEDGVQRQFADLEQRTARAALAARARASSAFLDDVVELILSQRKRQLSDLCTEHFHDLFSSNALVAQLEFTEDFRLVCYGQDGREVHRASLSAGTRQLIAVALIWALADAAAQDRPIAIDTPLARLDRHHRENVLLKYLPRASKQVILLPTDAELPESELNRIAERVFRHFELNNPTGEAVVVERIV